MGLIHYIKYIRKSESTLDLVKLAREQGELANLVKRIDDPLYNGSVVTGMDVAYSNSLAVGCAVAFDNTTKETVDTTTITSRVESEYIPGFFQLREGPVLLQLAKETDVSSIVLVDGNGVLHPRRFGLASYLGLKANLQTVGVAKRLMLGEIGQRVGDVADILKEKEIVGSAVWLGKKKPVYVSIGHRVSLSSAVRIVRESSIEGYPEALRRAHMTAKEILAREGD
jgi:deoxyribonuclease V